MDKNFQQSQINQLGIVVIRKPVKLQVMIMLSF